MNAKTFAAALVCLSTMCAPALALDLGLSIGANASTSSGEGSGLSLGLGANASADADLGLDGLGTTDNTASMVAANASEDASLTAGDELTQVIALIEGSVWTENSLSGIGDIEAIAYDVASWIDADNQAAFDLALSANADEIDDLHAAIAANATLESWLEANNATAEDVIAIGVAADGSLAVFTN